jgi:CheY-like chemotaxis protein
MELKKPAGIERILVVDDEPKNISSAETVLRASKLDYSVATSIEEAKEKIENFKERRGSYEGREYKIPLVVTDLEMNGNPSAGLMVAHYSFDRGIPALIATQREGGGNHGPITTLIPYGLSYGSKSEVTTWHKLLSEVINRVNSGDVFLYACSNICQALKNGPGPANFVIPQYKALLGFEIKEDLGHCPMSLSGGQENED